MNRETHALIKVFIQGWANLKNVIKLFNTTGFETDKHVIFAVDEISQNFKGFHKNINNLCQNGLKKLIQSVGNN